MKSRQGSRAAHLQHFLYRGLALPLVALAGLTFMTYKNMHGDKIAERIAAQKEAMRQARKEIEEAEDEHHE